MKKIFLLLLLSPVAFAQYNTTQNNIPTNTQGQREIFSPETERALQDCIDHSRKDHQGYPNRNDMKKCIEAKGYRVPDIVNPQAPNPKNTPYNGS